MNKKIKYFILFVVGFAIALAAASYRGVFQAQSTAMAMSALSDGFFLVAVLYIGVGLLTMIASTGFFDMAKYGLELVIDMFRKVPERKDKNFFEYTVRKRQERSEKASKGSMLVVGIVYLVVATIFMILFFQV